MIVLRLVAEKPTYGYEIIQELEQRGKDFFQLKEGTLYPVLYRLEDGGLIRSEWKLQEEETRRKNIIRPRTRAGKSFRNTGAYGNSLFRQYEICGEEMQ